MCGICGVIGHNDAARLTYLGLYALQHRGEESAGIAVSGKTKLHYHKGMGLVNEVFNEKSIKSLRGSCAVGHVRYSTTGSSHIKNIQPFLVNHKKGDIAIAHNGNLTNSVTLRDSMEETGSIFQTTMDSEIIAHLLAGSHNGYRQNTIDALLKLKGAYSLVMLYKDVLIGARDPFGFRPLCVGKLDNAYVLASETCALDLMCAEYIRDVLPGEIVFIEKGKLDSVKPVEEKRHALCIFEYIYFARPDSDIFGDNVYSVRKRLGRRLAEEFPVKADFVMPIPDSGVSAALGFAEQSKIPYETGMIRNHYVGRTFIQPAQYVRDFRVRVKLNPVRNVLKDKNVIVIEDSIVRGTTCRARSRALREAGAKKIHMGVSCPPIKNPCYYGIDFPTKRELIASSRTVEAVRDFIGLDSLKYLSLEGLLSCMGKRKHEFCHACFSGKYPETPPKRFSKRMLEKKRKK
ncbi:MAG: amidophosphoribosyltransferase [Candidatus Omnitrophota bacterium]